MKSFNKALSAAALLAVSGLSFAAEPMILGANDLDQVNAGFTITTGSSTTYSTGAGYTASAIGPHAAASASAASYNSSTSTAAPYSYSVSYSSGSTSGGAISGSTDGFAGIATTNSFSIAP